jgi:hypothetical protein
MYSTFHLKSAQDLNTDILDAIKATFKSKPITIIVEEDESEFALTAEMKAILEKRLQDPDEDYITGEESIEKLKEKYGL